MTGIIPPRSLCVESVDLGVESVTKGKSTNTKTKIFMYIYIYIYKYRYTY